MISCRTDKKQEQPNRHIVFSRPGSKAGRRLQLAARQGVWTLECQPNAKSSVTLERYDFVLLVAPHKDSVTEDVCLKAGIDADISRRSRTKWASMEEFVMLSACLLLARDNCIVWTEYVAKE